MQIGEVIRKYRKAQNLTQEEMAKRLGVTAPAVNKWENGNSTPDIALLAPIARMFHISVDELLAYKEELTEEEIKQYIVEMDQKCKTCAYDEVFQMGKTLLEEYPDCEKLLWQVGLLLDANRLFRQVEDPDQYDTWIVDWYQRALKSKDEAVRYGTAQSLYAFYMRKDNLNEAEKCLEYFSIQNPYRKQMKAEIARKKGKTEEAYRALEELIFSEFQMLELSLQSLYLMALEEEDVEQAAYYARKQKEIATVSEFGKYHENTYGLELLEREKDVDGTIAWMENTLNSVDEIWGFTNSPLYKHMKFKEEDEQFGQELIQELKNCFADEETFAYLSYDDRWTKLIEKE